MKKVNLLFVLIGLFPLFPAHAEVNLELIRLPPGVSIDVYTEGVENARQMGLGSLPD